MHPIFPLPVSGGSDRSSGRHDSINKMVVSQFARLDRSRLGLRVPCYTFEMNCLSMRRSGSSSGVGAVST